MSAGDAIPEPVRELAEVPDRFTRLTPGHVDRVETDRFVVVRGGWWASVEGIRSEPDEVEEVLREVREVTAGVTATWRIGPSAGPPDLERRLRALGLHTPTNGVSELAALATVGAPTAPPGDVRRVETLDDYRIAVGVRWDAFGKSEEQREAEQASLAETFEALQESGAVVDFLAYADGRPAGSDRRERRHRARAPARRRRDGGLGARPRALPDPRPRPLGRSRSAGDAGARRPGEPLHLRADPDAAWLRRDLQAASARGLCVGLSSARSAAQRILHCR